MRDTQFREEKLDFNIGDYVFYRPFGYKEIVYPCVIKGVFGEMIRGDFSLNLVLERLDENGTLNCSDVELLSVLPENEAIIWRLKS